MKQKYTITIADVEMNVITDETQDAVDTMVGMVDRKMREIRRSSTLCSKSEAALLCALDYCSEKIALQRQIKTIEAEVAEVVAKLEEANRRNDSLGREIDKLKAKNETLAKKAEMVGKIPVQLQMNINEEAPAEKAEEPVAEPVPEAPAAEAPRRRGRPPKNAAAPETTEAKKRVRSMFDLITFDRIDE
jgi:cell division protein ZapA (FtsZ GTPase activity inhibitor)